MMMNSVLLLDQKRRSSSFSSINSDWTDNRNNGKIKSRKSRWSFLSTSSIGEGSESTGNLTERSSNPSLAPRKSFSAFPSLKLNIKTPRSSKRNYSVLLRGSFVCTVSARPSDSLAKIRRRLAASSKNIDSLFGAAVGMPVNFLELQFLAFDHEDTHALTPVVASNEGVVCLRDCLSPNGEIVLGQLDDIQRKDSDTGSEAEALPQHAKHIFFTCRSISLQFRKAQHPDILQVLQLVDSLASFAKQSPQDMDLIWKNVESPFSNLEDILRKAHRRSTAFDTWYHLPSDRSAFVHAFSSIQSKLPDIAIASLILCFPAEPRNIISLRDKIKAVTLRCLHDSQHADIRAQLAKHLRITESDLLYQLKHLPTTPIASIKDSSINKSNLRDLASILAPWHHQDQIIISDNIARFTVPGMRQWAIESFDEWIREPHNRKHHVSVLASPPGTGKSAIASKIVRDRPDVVVAYHFCQHDHVGSCLAKTMLLSIAHQMAKRFPEYHDQLVKVITENEVTREDLFSDSITIPMIFTAFIETPLHMVNSIDPMDRHVIVIDGLDECYRAHHTYQNMADNASSSASFGASTEPKFISSSIASSSTTTSKNLVGASNMGRNEILHAIQKYFGRLPPWLNLYITTRPSLPILKKLKKFNARMEDLTEKNPGDLRIFYSHLLSKYGLYNNNPRKEDLIHCMVQNLLHKGQGSFLYATMVSKQLESLAKYNSPGTDNPSCNMSQFTLQTLPGRIEGLYKREWENLLAMVRGDTSQKSWMIEILSLVSAAFEPLHQITLVSLVNRTPAEVQDVLNLVPTILVSTDDGRVRFFHKSGKDFLVRENLLSGSSRPRGGGMGNGWSSSRELVGDLYINSDYGEPTVNLNPCSNMLQEYATQLASRQVHASMSRCLLRLMQEDPAILKPALFEDAKDRISKIESRNNKTLGPAILAHKKRDYVLRHSVSHLVSAGMKDEARKVLLDVAWLMARSDDGYGILNDYDLLEEDGDQVLKLVKRAIKLSLPTLRIDPRQFAGQLVGRLIASTVGGGRDSSVRLEVSDLLNRLKMHDFGFDWWCPVAPTWHQAEEACLRTFTGHTSAVQSVSWSADGKRTISASWDTTLRVWDMNGHCEQVLAGHDMPVWCVDWAPDCQHVVSGSLDKTLRMWDADNGECECVMAGHRDMVWAVSWSSDGTKLASGSKDKRCRIWNTSGETEKELIGHEGWVYAVAWSADGQQLLSGSTDNTVWIWTVSTGTCKRILEGHTDWVRSVAWANGDTQIISGSADRTVRVWAAQSGESEQVLTGHTDSVWSVDMCSDGRHVASSSTDGSIRIFDATTGRCEKILQGHQGPVWSVAWSPDGTRVVSGSTDTSAIVWDASLERDNNLTGHSASVWSVDQSVDGNRLVSGSADKSIRLWDASGNCIRAFTSNHNGPIWSVRLSTDGRRVVSGSTDNTARIYHVGTGEEKLSLSHPDSVWAVEWCNDDREICTASRDGLVRVFDSMDGKLVKTFRGHTADIRCLEWTKHGNRLASGSTDKTIRIWTTEDGNCQYVVKDCNSGVLSVAWSPNGEYLASGSADKLVRVFRVTSTGCVCKLTINKHTRRVNSVCWSPDGTKLVTGSTDKSVKIFDAQSGENLQTLTGHTGLGVYAVKWSSNGQQIISGSTDKTIRIWCAKSGQCLNVLTGHTGLGIYCVAWSEDGKKVCSGSRDRNIQIFNVETGECEQSLTGHTNWVYSVAWEKGGKRIASMSDDNTTRIWKVETGECEKVIEGSRSIPSDFDVASTSCPTKDLSLRSSEDEPIGIQFEKVQVFGERACGWKGKSVHFFRLMTSAKHE